MHINEYYGQHYLLCIIIDAVIILNWYGSHITLTCGAIKAITLQTVIRVATTMDHNNQTATGPLTAAHLCPVPLLQSGLMSGESRL